MTTDLSHPMPLQESKVLEQNLLFPSLALYRLGRSFFIFAYAAITG